MQTIQQITLVSSRRGSYVLVVKTDTQGKKKMATLLNAYRAAPTTANRAKLARYLDRHPMALCFATTEEYAFLKANEFIA
jgi:hypothetical protein